MMFFPFDIVRKETILVFEALCGCQSPIGVALRFSFIIRISY